MGKLVMGKLVMGKLVMRKLVMRNGKKVVKIALAVTQKPRNGITSENWYGMTCLTGRETWEAKDEGFGG